MAKRPKTTRAKRGPRKPVETSSGPTEGAADLRSLARDAALAALRRLADLSRSEDERVALAATQELLNRAFGKTATAGPDEASASQPLIIKIVKFGETADPQGGGHS